MIKTGTATVYPASFVSTDYSYQSAVSGYPASNPIGKSSTSTSAARFNWKTGSGASSYVYYKFDLSEIPDNAVINSISCSAKVYINNTNSNRVKTRTVQLCTGTTPKGSPSNMSTSTTALNLTCGDWTREELNDCRIKLSVTRGTNSTSTTYYFAFYGATLTIQYSYNSIDYYVTTVATGGSITPENPGVSNGESVLFSLFADNEEDYLLSLKVDNNDVTYAAVRKQVQSELDYNVEQVSGASYGFALNGGYWVSQNKGNASTAALCKINFVLPVECTVNFYLINYAEATYDYGLLSTLDTDLSTRASADTSGVFWDGKRNNNASEQKVTYTVPSGEHYITAKYFKDSYTNSYNDTLQFRIEIIPNEEMISGQYYYEYELENITSNCTLTAVFGQNPDGPGPLQFLFIKENGAWKQYSTAYKKIGGVWVQQTSLDIFNEDINYVRG